MKNATARYLLAAIAEDAAHIAKDQDEFDLIVTFGRVAVSAHRLWGLCKEEGDCEPGVVRKIRRFRARASFGAGEWYDDALAAALSGKPFVVDEVCAWRKEKFDALYREVYETKPPNLA
jgi:hypothetical protein